MKAGAKMASNLALIQSSKTNTERAAEAAPLHGLCFAQHKRNEERRRGGPLEEERRRGSLPLDNTAAGQKAYIVFD
jgi:hypothetical protein